MPNWIAITIDTLNEAKIAALINACATAARATGQPSRAPGKIQGVVNEVRRKVSNHHLVDVDPTKIPNSLKDFATYLVIEALKNAIEEPLTEDEVRLVKRANENLDKIENGIGVVETPEDPIEPEVSPRGPAVTLIRPNSCPHPFSKLGNS